MMENSANIAMFVLALLGCGYFFTKIMDWYNKYRYERYKDNSSEFISDIYKLKMKWARRGEYMYCKALDKIIGAETEQYEEDSSNPETEYGKDYLQRMKRVLEDEVNKRSDILQ